MFDAASPSSILSFSYFHSVLFPALVQSVVFLPPSTLRLPPSPLSVMKLKDGSVLLAYSAVCVMNESCPPRERAGTVVYTAEYRLMFSYGEGGNVGKMEGEIGPKEGRREGRKDR